MALLAFVCPVFRFRFHLLFYVSFPVVILWCLVSVDAGRVTFSRRGWLDLLVSGSC